ncbi:MAG: hypothetical protein ACYTFI_16025, partial [Planctomycetota bacterium]
LIVDDIRKDDVEREYVWNAPLPKDVYTAKSYELEGNTAILTDPEDNTKHLRVQVFGDSSQGAFAVEPIVPIADSRHRKKGHPLPQNLKYKSRTAGAKFRVLLYACKDGDPLPQISGRDGNYTIAIGRQEDRLRIAGNAGQISGVRLVRK